jgi:hypothetical protein
LNRYSTDSLGKQIKILNKYEFPIDDECLDMYEYSSDAIEDKEKGRERKNYHHYVYRLFHIFIHNFLFL